MNYITPSRLLPNELREALSTNETLYFSGQPIQYVPSEENRLNHWKAERYENCKEVVNLPLSGLTAVVRMSRWIAGPRQRMAAHEFLVLSGVHGETGDQYSFGDRPDAPFSIHTDPLGDPQSCLWRDSDVV